MQSRRSRSQFSARISAEIGDRNFPKIDLDECHCFSFASGLGLIINQINEHAHPLLAGTVGVNCPTDFSSRLYLNPFKPRFDAVVGVNPTNHQIRESASGKGCKKALIRPAS